MIDIKDINGNVIQSVIVTQNAERVEELMKSDYVQLSWSSDENVIIPVGAYIEYKGEKFALLEPYSPEQRDELEYEYKPQFHSKIMAWGKTPLFLYTQTESGISKETDWVLTDNPANFMSYIANALLNELGEQWDYAVSTDLAASATISFSTTDIYSALNAIASEFETEWWVDKGNQTIHLGKCQHGNAIDLEVGVNVKYPSVTKNKEGYFTRFYAFGSTRNIEQDYEGANANNIVNKRLTLDPTKYPEGYKDVREGLKEGEIFSKVLIFDDVYPSSQLTISNVRVRLLYRLDDDNNKVQVGTDENGNPIYDQYAIWYFQLPNFDYDENNVIEGLVPSINFKTGALSGREFEIIYHDKAKDVATSDGEPFKVLAGDYEICFIEEGTYIIPSVSGLTPTEGDEVILFNIKMPEEYKQSAYKELEDALDKEIERMNSDLNTYQLQSNAVAFYDNNPNLSLGQKVRYVNGAYSFETRVMKLVTKLDYDCEQVITIGNEKIKGNTEQLKEEVVNANTNINFLAALNETTNSLTQAYQRTQKMMMEGFASIKDMWVFDEKDKNTIYSKFNIYSLGYVSAKGANPNTGGSEGGATKLGGLTNVTADADKTYEVAKMLVLEAKSNLWTLKNLSDLVGGLDEAELEQYLTNNEYAKKSDIPSLSGYATEQWVLGKGYATISDLDTRIDALVNGAPQAYDTLKEIADVLAGNVNSISDILTALGNKADKATTLSGYGITDAYTIAQIDSIVKGFSGNISTLQGYFTDGVANSALRLSDNGSYTAWGQTFFTKGKPKSLSGALTDVTDITSSGTITANKIFIGNGTIEWDETNKGFKITGGLYTESYLSAKGANTNGGSSSGDGLITSLYRYADLGKTFADTSNDTFNAYTINKINTDLGSRISVLEGKATNVAFTQSLTSGTALGTLTIDGASKTIYAPTIPTKLSQFTDDVVSGKYLPLSGGTITGLLTINGSSTNNNRATIHLVSNGNYPNDLYFGSNNTFHWSLSSRDSNNNYYFGLYNAITTKWAFTVNSDTNIVNYEYLPTYIGKKFIHEGNYTDYAYSKTTIDSKLGGYLPLSGGDINGYIRAYNYRFINNSGTYLGLLSADSNDENTLYFATRSATFYALIHSGNIGSQSVANSDKLDGLNSTDFVRSYGIVGANYAKGNWSGYTYATAEHDGAAAGGIISFGLGSDYCQINGRASTSNMGLYYRVYAGEWSNWKKIAFTDSNVASSTKLQTARTIWGQSFDGSGNVDGVLYMTNSGAIATKAGVLGFDSNTLYVGYSNVLFDTALNGYNNVQLITRSKIGLTLNSSGNVLIGTTTDSGYKLDVVGDVRFSSATGQNSYIYLNRNGSDGGLLFQYKGVNKWQIVNTNNGLDFYDYTRGVYALKIGIDGVLNYIGTIHSTTGIYSDGYVSAKGQNTSSDMRLKNVLNAVVLGVKDIANAPSMRFTWKNGGGIDVGSSAQYWQNVLPDAVKERDGKLEMQYANIALLSAIALAKNFETMDERVSRLEKENEELRTKIYMMERGIA